MERKLKTGLVVAGGPALLVNGPDRSCLSGLMMIRREGQAALIMRANGGHPNVRGVAEVAMTGEMMEVNAGRKKRSTQKIFTRDLAWSKTVLKRTTKSLQVMGEQDSNLEEKVARLSRILPSLHLTGTRYLQLNLPSTRQVG